jgi:hypothetical protein
MAKKRTKKQKQQALQNREATLSYSLDEIKTTSPKKIDKKSSAFASALKKGPSTKKKSRGLTNVNNSQVIKDLLKTLVVTVLVLFVLIAYTIYYK